MRLHVSRAARIRLRNTAVFANDGRLVQLSIFLVESIVFPHIRFKIWRCIKYTLWRLFGAAAAHAKFHVCLVLLVGRVPRHGFRLFSKQRETNMVRSRDWESQDRVTFNMKNTSYYRF